MIDSQQLFDGLTEPQAAAVRHVDGPLLIIAGAGSGKTRVLTRRVAHLVSLGIPAIAIGAGGSSGGAHSLQEWYDPTGREIGMQRVLLILLQVAGLNPPTS